MNALELLKQRFSSFNGFASAADLPPDDAGVAAKRSRTVGRSHAVFAAPKAKMARRGSNGGLVNRQSAVDTQPVAARNCARKVAGCGRRVGRPPKSDADKNREKEDRTNCQYSDNRTSKDSGTQMRLISTYKTRE
jgi:hypothetical protein